MPKAAKEDKKKLQRRKVPAVASPGNRALAVCWHEPWQWDEGHKGGSVKGSQGSDGIPR